MTASTVVLVCLAAVAAVGWRAAKKRNSGMADYFLAGRALSLPFFVATLVPTFYGGVLGVGEFTWEHGLSNWLVMAAPYYLFAALYAHFLAGRVRLKAGLTIPDHLESAYGKSAALWSSALVFLLSLPADEVLMCGALLSYLMGIGLFPAEAAAASLAAWLLWRGGLRADVWTNSLEFIVMFGGFALMLPFAWLKFGGLTSLKHLVPPGHFSLLGGLSPWRLLAWWLIALWTLVDPSFHQRCAAAQNPQTARKGILVSILFWALFDAMTTATGLYARAALPALKNPVMAFPALADAVLPPVARGFFFAALASSILAGLQGKSLIAAVTLGKDALGRTAQIPEAAMEKISAWALITVLACSCLLAWLIPSVVGIWYDLGSAAIPGLLWPMLGVYFPRLRASPRRALAASIAGFGISCFWLAGGTIKASAPFLGIEPMFPGLFAATALWWLPEI